MVLRAEIAAQVESTGRWESFLLGHLPDGNWTIRVYPAETEQT